jgi:glycosyltransferase involved in cell wall biosynthesis
MTRIVALVPGYQEGPRIGAVVSSAGRHLPVLVVDDGSTDDTARNAEAAGAEVIRQVPNQGKGAALRAGFRHALDEGWDAVVTLDADGQHDPDEIQRFVAAFKAPGASPRPGSSTTRLLRMPPAAAVERRAVCSRGPSGGIRRPVRVPAAQPGSQMAIDSRETGFELEVEMIAVCLRNGWTLDWVPISTIYAGEPSHVKPLAHLRHFLRATLAARRLVREPR